MSTFLAFLIGYPIVGACVGVLVCTEWWQRRVLGCDESLSPGPSIADRVCVISISTIVWPLVLLVHAIGDE